MRFQRHHLGFLTSVYFLTSDFLMCFTSRMSVPENGIAAIAVAIWFSYSAASYYVLFAVRKFYLSLPVLSFHVGYLDLF